MPSGRIREFDVDAAVDAALLVFWSRGYEGASMAELVDATGVRRGSLYAAFGSKEGLFRRALRRYADTVGSYVAQALAAPDATAVAETLLRGAVDAGTGDGTPSGCLFVQGALSCSVDGEPVRDELAGMRAAGEAALRDRFAELARAGDDVAAATDPDLLAGLLVTLRQGLSVKARTGADRAELHALVDLAIAGPPFGSTVPPP